MIKLKPCPFCGSKMITVYEAYYFAPYNPDRSRKWYAICDRCNATGPGIHFTAVQAARAWNKRKGEKENEN